jgi:hypothetical protein
VKFALASVAMAAGAMLLLLVAADVYTHWRTQDLAGVNVWGYRGAPIGDKEPGETRVVVLGDSTVFGWGLPLHESITALLQSKLNAAGEGRRFSVANLGAPEQGAYGYVFDLADYEFLDYDIVIMYGGYNDLPSSPRGVRNFLLWRRQSPLFRWFGYHPMLAMVLREKSIAMMQGGDVNAAAAGFTPGLATRSAAGTMRFAATLADRVVGNDSGPPATPPVPATDASCVDTWQVYCGSVREAVTWARQRGKAVIVATPPFVSEEHVEQQTNLAAMLESRFGRDPQVRYVNLGREIDLRDASITSYGVHLVAAGNASIAERLMAPVMASVGPQ